MVAPFTLIDVFLGGLVEGKICEQRGIQSNGNDEYYGGVELENTVLVFGGTWKEEPLC